jgi:transposase
LILVNPFKLKIYLYPNRIDMRKSWSGLVGLIENSLKINPYDKSIFVFLGNNRKRIKIIYWDGNGFCIWMKRLDAGIFPFLEDNKIQITKQELIWLLSGVDSRKKHKIIDIKKK